MWQTAIYTATPMANSKQKWNQKNCSTPKQNRELHAIRRGAAHAHPHSGETAHAHGQELHKHAHGSCMPRVAAVSSIDLVEDAANSSEGGRLSWPAAATAITRAPSCGARRSPDALSDCDAQSRTPPSFGLHCRSPCALRGGHGCASWIAGTHATHGTGALREMHKEASEGLLSERLNCTASKTTHHFLSENSRICF